MIDIRQRFSFMPSFSSIRFMITILSLLIVVPFAGRAKFKLEAARRTCSLTTVSKCMSNGRFVLNATWRWTDTSAVKRTTGTKKKKKNQLLDFNAQQYRRFPKQSGFILRIFVNKALAFYFCLYFPKNGHIYHSSLKIHITAIYLLLKSQTVRETYPQKRFG